MKTRRLYALLSIKIYVLWQIQNVDLFFLLSQRLPLGLNTGHKGVVRGQRKSEAPHDFFI